MNRLMIVACATSLILAGCSPSSNAPQSSHSVTGGTRLPASDYRGTVLGNDEISYEKGRYSINEDGFYDGTLLPYTGTDASIPADDTVDHLMSDEEFDFESRSEPSLRQGALLSVQGSPKLLSLSEFSDSPCADGYEEFWLEEYETEMRGPMTESVNRYGISGQSPHLGDGLFLLLPKRNSDDLRVDFRTSSMPKFFMFRFRLGNRNVIGFQATSGQGIPDGARSFQGEWFRALGVGPGMATAIHGVSLCAAV